MRASLSYIVMLKQLKFMTEVRGMGIKGELDLQTVKQALGLNDGNYDEAIAWLLKRNTVGGSASSEGRRKNETTPDCNSTTASSRHAVPQTQKWGC